MPVTSSFQRSGSGGGSLDPKNLSAARASRKARKGRRRPTSRVLEPSFEERNPGPAGHGCMSGAAPARLRTRILITSSSADSPVMSLRRHVDGGGASRKALQLARLVGTDREPLRSDPSTAGTRRGLLLAGQRPAGAAPDRREQPEDPRPARCAAQDEHLLLWRGRTGPRVHVAGYSCAPSASTRCVPSVYSVPE